jgi:hypothetical protein
LLFGSGPRGNPVHIARRILGGALGHGGLAEEDEGERGTQSSASQISHGNDQPPEYSVSQLLHHN